MRKKETPPNEKGADTYAVGYKRPPTQHRFKKGMSGNPSGRPKRSGRGGLRLDPAQQPTRSMILQEAYRLVTLREGGKVIKLPLIQAVIRSAGFAALKGNRFAQRFLADMIHREETRVETDEAQLLQEALKYKKGWLENFQFCDERGIQRPKVLPHPDDIAIDIRTGKVQFNGPLSEEEETKIKEALDDLQIDFAAARRRMEVEPENQEWREDALLCQAHFDRINNLVPKRLKRRLKGRI